MKKPLPAASTSIFAADEKFLSVGAVAQYFDVTEVTIKNWVERGSLLAARTAGGHRRITVSSVITLLQEQHRAIPSELSLRPVFLVVEASDVLTKVLRRTVGARARVLTSHDDVSAAFAAARERPELVVIDLELSELAPKRLLSALRADEVLRSSELMLIGRATLELASPSIGFFHHLRGDDRVAMLELIETYLTKGIGRTARRA